MGNTMHILALVFVGAVLMIQGEAAMFGDKFTVAWGDVKLLNNGETAQLTLDKTSGSGFQSKEDYLFSSSSMRMKLISGNSAGIVTSFYMTSEGQAHDELDFEFLGNVAGKPITLQTNVFANGVGNREQRIRLWFDPTQDFHNYSILWNQHQAVFLVDSVPIRVFRNNEAAGVAYPRSRPMRILSTLWNGEDWATDGGKIKIDWSLAPFSASYQLFDVAGCPASTASAATTCTDVGGWWTASQMQSLSSDQLRRLKWVKSRYMTYDYCTDTSRFSSTPPECALNP